ncbi:hypothetical protein HDU81_002854 [Chytriomyces hyalinus]|nr:hypothetical protein HDU81_002854 [Chytriomyces hyalinus]
MQPQTCEDTYVNNHGSFSYTKYKQVHQRLPCSVMIPPNEIKHSGLHIHTENPDDFHFCHQRCPFCNYFCTLEVGHQGDHDTSHGSMEQTVFTNAGDDEFEYGSHKFNRNDSGKCFLCQLYCKELKRHAHIDWCRHPDDPHLCDRDGEGSSHIHETLLPDPSKPKDYVTHETCWKRTGFKDPYSEEEKKFFSLCDAECSGEEHKAGEGHDPSISLKSFCRLPMFHAPLDSSIQPPSGYISKDGHQFGCSNPAGSVAGFHLVFALDRSGSMASDECGPLQGTPYENRIRSRHPNCFGAAIDASYRFCVTRNSAIRSGVDSNTANDKDIITLITFDGSARTICSGLANFTPNSILDTLVSSPGAGGWTSFHSTIEAIRASVTAHYDRELTPIIIFLSDGEDSMPTNSLSTLVRENNARGQTIYFYTILFSSGYYGGITVLNEMAEFVEQNQTVKPKSGSTSGFYHAIDEVKLSEHFTGLADSLKTCKPSLLKIGGGIGVGSNLTLGRIGGQHRI